MKNALYFILGFALIASMMLVLDGGPKQQNTQVDYQAYSKRIEVLK